MNARVATAALIGAGMLCGTGLAEDKAPSPYANAIEETLHLADYRVERIEIAGGAGGEALAPVTIQGIEYLLELRPASVRSNDFRVLVQGEDGELRDHAAPASRVYRGTVFNMPGSQVSATIENGQMTAMIFLDQERQWFIQPLDVVDASAPDALHVLYRHEDVLTDGNYSCGVADDIRHPQLDHAHDHGDDGPIIASGLSEAELAFDADYDFYIRNGSNVDATIADIENIVNSMNVIYERDCQITHKVTTIIVRSTSDDPYTSSDPGTLLEQFRSEWNRNQGGVRRDVAHLMTGRNMNGGTIGIAWLGVVCNTSMAYGLSESRYTSNFSHRVGLTAHEVGHNWNAGHCCGGCSGCSSCRIMCPCLGGCSGIVNSFGSGEISQIVNFRNSRSCLDKAADMELEVGPLFRGQNGTFEVTGGTPNSEVRIYYSLRGEGETFISDFGVTLDLNNAKLGATDTTDSSGNATIVRRMPSPGRIIVLWFQAAQEGLTSNVVLSQLN